MPIHPTYLAIICITQILTLVSELRTEGLTIIKFSIIIIIENYIVHNPCIGLVPNFQYKNINGNIVSRVSTDRPNLVLKNIKSMAKMFV